MSLLVVYLGGCALLVAALRWWRPQFPWRAACLHVALVTAFFAQPLLFGALQVPTDIAYQSLPFKEAVAEKVVARNPARADALLQDLPFHSLVRQRLRAWEAPLWSHELGTGEPLLGNAQSAPGAPLHLMALPLAPLQGLTAAAAWGVLVGLLLAHALLLHLGAGPLGAAIGAVAAGLSVYATAWSYDVVGMAAAWVPGVLLGILLTLDREPRAQAGLVGCALGVVLSGHPETTAHVALLAAVVTAAQLVRHPRRPFAGLARLAAPAALIAALAAPALLPVLQTLPESERWHGVQQGSFDLEGPSFAPRFLLPLFSPLAFGSPRDGNYREALGFNELCSPYAGLLALALALAGALAARRRIGAILLGGCVAMAAALDLPPTARLLSSVPGLSLAQHGRLRHFWVLAIAVASGLVVERVAEDRRLRALATACIAAAGAMLALVPPPGGAPWQRAWWLAALAGAGAALAVLWVPAWRARFPVVVLAALGVDLFLLGVRYQPAVPARLNLALPPALSFLVAQSRAAPEPFRVLAEADSLAPNLGAMFGLWDPRGNDPMRPEDAARVVGWRLGRHRRFYEAVSAKRWLGDQAGKDFLAVRFLLTEHERKMPAPWRLAFEGAGGKVWENPQALSLFFVPRTVQRWATSVDALRITLDEGDLGAIGVMAGAGGERGQQGTVHGIRPLSNGFDLTVESAAGAMVFSSVSYAPGWVARIGGRERQAIEVDGGFLGFEAPAGSHLVELRYRPRGWTLGLVLFAGGLAAAAMACRGRRRRRSSHQRGTGPQPAAIATLSPTAAISTSATPGSDGGASWKGST
jgi:hypothetical protein